MNLASYGFGGGDFKANVPSYGYGGGYLTTVPGLACLTDFAPAVDLVELVASVALSVVDNVVSLVDNSSSVLLSDWGLDEQEEIPSIVVLAELASGVALQDSSTELLLEETSPIEVAELTSGVEVSDVAQSVTLIDIIEEKCP